MLRSVAFAVSLAVTSSITVAPEQARADDGKRFFGIVDALNGVKEKLCADDPPETMTKSNLPKSTKSTPSLIPAVFGAGKDEFKSEGDLRRYLECYLVEPGRWSVVEKSYLPLIKTAAASFDIPETLLACLIFRESRFNIHAKSSAGAIGLGQHLRGTMTHISNILKPGNPKQTANLLEISKMTIEEQMSAKKRTAGEARKSLRFARTKLEDREHRLGWESYFENLEDRKLHRGAVPRVVNVATIKDPKIAIGATAMYMRMIIYHFKKTLDQDLRIDQNDDNDPNYYMTLAAAGAYNMGYGAAQKILSPIEPPNRKKWVEALARSNEETAAHVLSIQNCIRAPGKKDEDPWVGPIGSSNYNCEDRSPGENRVTTGRANPLPKEYRSNVKSATLKKSAPVKKASPKPKKDSAQPTTKTPAQPAAKSAPKSVPKTATKPAAKPAPVKK